MMNPEPNTEWRLETKYLVAVGLVIFALYVIHLMRSVLSLLVLASLIAMVANPTIRFLQLRLKIPRRGAVAITYLLASGDTMPLRLFTAGAVVLGYLSHLVLDEIYSVEWTHGLRLKSSFGTALKLFGQSGWSNISVYAKLLLLTGVIFFEPQWPQTLDPGNPNSIRQTATRLIDRVLHRG